MGTANARRSNSTAGDHEIVLVAHASCGFTDLVLVIRYHLDTLQVDSQTKTELSEVIRVSVDSLNRRKRQRISIIIVEGGS